MVNWELEIEVEKGPHPISVYLLEGLGQLLDYDASPNEPIEGDATCLVRNRWSASKSRGTGGSDRGSSFKHVFPKEDRISDCRLNRAGRARRGKEKGITVFPFNELEELRG